MNRQIPVIIFLGAPGAGKGTQAEHVAKLKSIPKISTGDMLRAAIQQESDLGRKVKGIMTEGKLVDDETMLSLVVDRIHQPDCENGFILDGYPRNLQQAGQLETVLENYHKMVVVEISVSEEEIVRRIAGRRTCPSCHRIYNVYSRPPKENERCDVDGTALFRRSDDQEDVVRKRIETYKNETLPLIEHYQQKGILHVIDGSQPEDLVMAGILQVIG